LLEYQPVYPKVIHHCSRSCTSQRSIWDLYDIPFRVPFRGESMEWRIGKYIPH